MPRWKTIITDTAVLKILNEDVAEFNGLNPTAENIAIVIYRMLRPAIDDKLDMQVRLYETERNFVDYPAN